MELVQHFLDGIEIKDFYYNKFLATMMAAEQQALSEIFTWWRHAAL